MNKGIVTVMNWSVAWLLFAYQAAVVIGFFIAYSSIGFGDNFSNSHRTNNQNLTLWYYCVVTSSSTGFGDIVPTTDRARLLVSLHVALAWFPILLLAALVV